MSAFEAVGASTRGKVSGCNSQTAQKNKKGKQRRAPWTMRFAGRNEARTGRDRLSTSATAIASFSVEVRSRVGIDCSFQKAIEGFDEKPNAVVDRKRGGRVRYFAREIQRGEGTGLFTFENFGGRGKVRRPLREGADADGRHSRWRWIEGKEGRKEGPVCWCVCAA